jgi:hypothetical protein
MPPSEPSPAANEQGELAAQLSDERERVIRSGTTVVAGLALMFGGLWIAQDLVLAPWEGLAILPFYLALLLIPPLAWWATKRAA